MIIKDTKYIIKYMEDSIDISNKIGIVGYCMSGRFVVSIAAVFNKKIKATASFYGVDIITNKKDSPHLLAKKIKGELYLAFAEKDIWVPKKVLDKATLIFSNLKIKSKVEIYKGTEPWFCISSKKYLQ